MIGYMLPVVKDGMLRWCKKYSSDKLNLDWGSTEHMPSTCHNSYNIRNAAGFRDKDKSVSGREMNGDRWNGGVFLVYFLALWQPFPCCNFPLSPSLYCTWQLVKHWFCDHVATLQHHHRKVDLLYSDVVFILMHVVCLYIALISACIIMFDQI